MNRNRHDAVPRWRRRLALIGGAFGLLLLNLAFVVLPVAADGHSGRDGNRHDGQNVEAEHRGNDMDANRHDANDNDINDDRGNDVNDNDVNDDRGNDANDNDVNDDRGNDGMQQMVLIPKMMTTASGR